MSDNATEENAKKLNPESEDFDPMLALYAKNNPYVDPSVPAMDNLAMFENIFNQVQSVEIDLTELRNKKQNKPSSDASASTSKVQHIERQFEQTMVKGYIRAKHKKNVLNTAENFKGPLKALYGYMQLKTKVKIYIRHNHGIRGYVTGYIEIFDKHWNVIVKDAEEFYRRRKFYYCDQASGFTDSAVEDCSARLKELGIELPELSVKSINRKNVECRRKIPEILIRGEQIALVTSYTEASS